MGLYLCIFDEDDEVAGVEVGPYADYNAMRNYLVKELEAEKAGSRFPTLILHSDCDGEWSVDACQRLAVELDQVIAELRQRPAVPFSSDWQQQVAKSIGITQRNAFESFIDVDGEFLLERLRALVDMALERRLPILFQ